MLNRKKDWRDNKYESNKEIKFLKKDTKLSIRPANKEQLFKKKSPKTHKTIIFFH